MDPETNVVAFWYTIPAGPVTVIDKLPIPPRTGRLQAVNVRTYPGSIFIKAITDEDYAGPVVGDGTRPIQALHPHSRRVVIRDVAGLGARGAVVERGVIALVVFALALILVIFLRLGRPSSDQDVIDVDVVQNGEAENVGSAASILTFITK